MIRLIRKSRFLRIISILMIIIFLDEIIFPTIALALTGGPSQPEVESFSPIETTDMVDLFSGDFKYNIPLLDVDGYPININYNSNITMDQEASWVGLGWNLNPGVINRTMRGLPDEFCGDQVTKEYNLKEDNTYGLKIYLRPEIFSKSLDFIKLGYVLSWSTKNGFNLESNIGITGKLAEVGGSKLNVGINFSSSTNGNFNFSPSISFSNSVEGKNSNNSKDHNVYYGGFGGSLGFSVNSLSGLQSMQLGISASNTTQSPKYGKQTSSGSIGLNSTLSFVPNTYTPQIGIPIENNSADVNLNLGTDIMVVDAFGAIGGYYLNQKVRENIITKSAYGYINNSIGNRNINALLDFNREKDITYHPEIKNLPITQQTYDIYSVLGQGINGTFRSYSNEAGFIFDDFNQNTSSSFNAGAEIAATNVVKGGADETSTSVLTNSCLWSSMNAYVPDYYNKNITNLLYEPTNFKMIGESNVESDLNYLNNTAFPNVSRLDLNNQFFGTDAFLNDKFLSENAGSTNSPAKQYRGKRQKRNQYIQSLNATEARLCGLEKNIRSYHLNPNGLEYTNTGIVFEEISRDNILPQNIISHHPSELSIYKTDGSHYVYGIPAYVAKQVEASFSVNDYPESVPSNGLIHYDAIQDSKSNPIDNERYYSKTILPPYAHSYLLTAVLSQEYIDLTGDGPTDDDMGNYSKFNYTSMRNEMGQYYKWRTPFEEYFASYNEGKRYDKKDAKGSYIYGEKDIWYLHSIETKNYVVDFIISDRCDAYGVKGDAGGRNNVNLQKKLKEIRLYSKKDKIVNGINAIPIKVVHFEYEYSLCKGIPNNNNSTDSDGFTNQGGKLTLKKIYFTYSKSFKGKLNPYQFNYSYNKSIYNPNYEPKGCDRWGFYNPQENNQLGDLINSFEFPYVDQRKLTTDYISNNNPNPEHHNYADIYSCAWSLSEIITPSGASIKMKYESDDYAYVQNKRAMEMMKIIGFCDKNTYTPNNLLYTPSSGNNRVIIEVPKDNFNSDINSYFVGVNQLYLKCLVKLTEKDEKGLYEYISCYANIDSYGTIGEFSSTNRRIWVNISCLDTDHGNENPVSVQAWQHCMENDKWIISGGTAPDENPDVLAVIKKIAFLDILSNLVDAFNGPCKTAIDNGIALTFKPDNSWVRLNNPNFKKFGGGSRISEIRISDNWNQNSSGQQNKDYGQIYDYTMNENDNIISSGIASYEPLVGGDENPFRTAMIYKTSEGFLKPDTYGLLETPLGESFYPAPTVGYKQVTVKNLQNDNVKKHATGKVVHEFYTSRDFPTQLSRQTDLKAIPLKSGFLDDLFSPVTYNKMFTAQGYLFETNDMHGKIKSVKVYAEGKDDPISGEEYNYRQVGNHLNNRVVTLDKLGNKGTNLVSFDYDIVNDFRESSTVAVQDGSQINCSFFFAGIFPIIIPPVWPTYSENTTLFRSAVTTKVINYYGVLQDVVKFDQTSRVKTSNEVYDAETGEVLLTKTQNEFNDSLFSFTYPAHWVYNGMSPSYENTGFTTYSLLSINNGIINIGSILTSNTSNSSARELFTSGDEVLLKYKQSSSSSPTNTNIPYNTYNWKTAWVLDLNDNEISLIDEIGNKISNGTINYLKVIHSGRKNQHILPIANISSRKNPIPYLKTGNIADAGILETQAIEYDNTRKIYCGDQTYICKVELSPEYNDIMKLFGYLFNNHILTTYPSTIPQVYYIHPINLLSTQYQGILSNLIKSKFNLQSNEAIYISGIIDNRTSVCTEWPDINPSCCSNYSYFIITSGANNLTSNPFESVLYNIFDAPQVLPIDFQSTINSNNLDDLFLFSFKLRTPGGQLCTQQTPPNLNNINNLPFSTFLSNLQSSISPLECTYPGLIESTTGLSIIKYPGNESLKTAYIKYDFLGNFGEDKYHMLKHTLVPSYASCSPGVGNVVNPYVNGVLGSWGPRTIHKYLAERKRTENLGNGITTNLKVDGDYLIFSPFWKYNQLGRNEWGKANPIDNNWVWTNTVTIKDRNGSEVENKNALGIYSAALFGFEGNYATAVSANTRNKEIASEGFEDPLNNTPSCYRHLNYIFEGGYAISTNENSIEKAHTGIYSMKIDTQSGDPVFWTNTENNNNIINRYIKIKDPDNESKWSNQMLNTTDNTVLQDFIIDNSDCKAKFSPDTAKDYIISYWIYNENNIISLNNSNLSLDISTAFGNNGITLDPVLKISKPIEGWQRVERIIHVAANAMGNFKLQFIRNNAFSKVFLDDLRILPVNGSMKAYVYNIYNKRLMAELDENNYASFYEYDEDGSLVRVKKESEKGIYTIKEIRKNIQK